MKFIDNQLVEFRNLFDQAIKDGGVAGKNNLIRSSKPINLIHDAVKHELIQNGVNPQNIHPKLFETSPEIKIAGFLKQKNQDVCVTPSNIPKEPTAIDWGPLVFEDGTDEYGSKFSANTLIINIRSQMSSIAKNADTLFERTIAEALNLHLRYENAVLGEVYLIPVYEYDDELAKRKIVGFKNSKTNLEKYIAFFSEVNNRKDKSEKHKYERVALLIVDFSKKFPKLYRSSKQLVEEGLLSKTFPLKYEELNFDDFAKDLLQVYSERFDIENILT